MRMLTRQAEESRTQRPRTVALVRTHWLRLGELLGACDGLPQSGIICNLLAATACTAQLLRNSISWSSLRHHTPLSVPGGLNAVRFFSPGASSPSTERCRGPEPCAGGHRTAVRPRHTTLPASSKYPRPCPPSTPHEHSCPCAAMASACACFPSTLCSCEMPSSTTCPAGSHRTRCVAHPPTHLRQSPRSVVSRSVQGSRSLLLLSVAATHAHLMDDPWLHVVAFALVERDPDGHAAALARLCLRHNRRGVRAMRGPTGGERLARPRTPVHRCAHAARRPRRA